MPFAPELFSARALARLDEKRQRELVRVPFFDGLMAGEPDALVKSFAVVPELHDPIRGRVKGTSLRGVRLRNELVAPAAQLLGRGRGPRHH
jgi:hypothetical protein